MNCPKCQKDSLKIVEEHGIELDYCETCGGIWFDNDELIKVLELSKGLVFDKVRNKNTTLTVDYKTAMCPRCTSVTLQKLPDKKIAGLMIDQCPNCKGIWLDGGEFHRMMRDDVMSKIKNYLL